MVTSHEYSLWGKSGRLMLKLFKNPTKSSKFRREGERKLRKNHCVKQVPARGREEELCQASRSERKREGERERGRHQTWDSDRSKILHLRRLMSPSRSLEASSDSSHSIPKWKRGRCSQNPWNTWRRCEIRGKRCGRRENPRLKRGRRSQLPQPLFFN